MQVLIAVLCLTIVQCKNVDKEYLPPPPSNLYGAPDTPIDKGTPVDLEAPPFDGSENGIDSGSKVIDNLDNNVKSGDLEKVAAAGNSKSAEVSPGSENNEVTGDVKGSAVVDSGSNTVIGDAKSNAVTGYPEHGAVSHDSGIGDSENNAVTGYPESGAVSRGLEGAPKFGIDKELLGEIVTTKSGIIRSCASCRIIIPK